MFAALGQAAAGSGERPVITGAQSKANPPSNWKAAASREGLR